jgi:diadenosine tetraphosphatase ApaH/serine/threonine PP2A family protein phosphatase
MDGIDRLVCLGDILGYGARPAECLRLIREWADEVVVGNHDLAAIDRADFGRSQRNGHVTAWMREQLEDCDIDYLASLPRIAYDDHLVAVHGCYLNEHHYYGYITPTMCANNLERIAAHTEWPRVALCGHTHIPMLAWLDSESHESEHREGSATWPRRARAVIVNPGSVGQPRDTDRRAAFAVIDTDAHRVEFVRIEYDVASAVQDIRDAGLPEEYASRLEDGR